MLQQQTGSFTGFRPGIFLTGRPDIHFLPTDDRARSRAAGRTAHGFRIDRHSEPTAFRAGRDGYGIWLRRRTRQTDHLFARRSLPAQGQGRTNRPYPCADPYLFRLSGRQRSARTFRPRRFRENPENIRRIYAGMALHARRTRPRLKRRMAHRSVPLRKSGDDGRYRHSCPATGRIHLRAAMHIALRRPAYSRGRTPARRRRRGTAPFRRRRHRRAGRNPGSRR